MYLAGLIGLQVPFSRPIFLQLTAFNLWVSIVLLLFFNESWSNKHIYLFIIIFFIGYFIEVLGVHTGMIFGQYSYGSTLGYKVFNVPIAIGANWLLLSYLFCYFSRNVVLKFTNNSWLIAIFSSLLMVLLDFVIEPIAINFDFWNWQNGSIPIQNYLAWFFVSLLINMIYLQSKLTLKNKIASLMLILQVLFFICHHIINSIF
jgi:uncharacterized membrane protein